MLVYDFYKVDDAEIEAEQRAAEQRIESGCPALDDDNEVLDFPSLCDAGCGEEVAWPGNICRECWRYIRGE